MGGQCVMIQRFHTDLRAISSAVYSDCGSYRYALTRESAPGARLLYVMLNPSTANETRNDATVERCDRRARLLGFGAFRVVNLFAFRATDPRVLKAASAPIGPDNDTVLHDGALWADRILCAWGTHGAHLGRDAQVERMLRQTGRDLWHLGLTRQGMPRHPLYISYDCTLRLWN